MDAKNGLARCLINGRRSFVGGKIDTFEISQVGWEEWRWSFMMSAIGDLWMDGWAKGERTPEGVQSKPTLPLQPLTEPPGGKIDEDLLALGNATTKQGWCRYVRNGCCHNGWTHKGGTHSLRSSFSAYNAITPIITHHPQLPLKEVDDNPWCYDVSYFRVL